MSAAPRRPRLILTPLEPRLTPAFTPTAPVAAGVPDPFRLLAGRFDANAFADVAVLERPDEGTPRVAVRLGSGGGGFPGGSVVTGPPLNQTSGGTTGDFNRDGRTDLVIVSGFGNPGVQLFLGNGDGTFQAPITLSDADTDAVATGDFTGDGLTDLVTLGFNAGFQRVFTVFAGNGGGGFAPLAQSSATAASARRLVTADLDGNGTADLAAVDPFQSRLVVRYGVGDGTFSDDVFTTLSASAQDLAVADFVPDANGRPDLVIVEGGAVRLRRNLGNGTFDPAGVTLAVIPNVSPFSGVDSTRVAAADFDGDGAPDLVYVDRTLDAAAVLLNQGNGTFTPDPRNRTYSVLGGASDVVVADVDGDAHPDFVTLSRDTYQGNVIRAFVNDAADATVTTLTVSADPLVFGQSVTLTATVRAVVPTEGVPAGSVTFRNGADVIGVVPLTDGVARLTLPLLPAGGYALAAEYGGFTPPPPAPVTRLGGYVYDDFDDDGVKQDNEFGIGGAVVTLYRIENGQSTVAGRVTTGDNGFYEFTDLPTGTYDIAEEQPAGFVSGRNTVGTINGGPGVGSVAGDSFQNLPLAAGDIGQGYNFGEQRPGLIAGFVYADANENGVRNFGEPGIGGVTVSLFRVENGVPTFLASTLTDGSGFYQFPGLAPGGGYRLVETQPTLYANGPATPGTGGGTAGVNVIDGVSVSAGGFAVGNNFGELFGAISGFVYRDFGSGTPANNDNGLKDPGEAGIGGVTVTLVRVVGGSPVTLATTLTDSAGAYRFGGLFLGGGYRVVETQPGGFNDGIDTPGSPGDGFLPPNTNDLVDGITLRDPARVSPNNNFGERPSPPPLNAPLPPPPFDAPPVAEVLPGVPSRFRPSTGTATLTVTRAATVASLAVTAANVPTGRPFPVTVQVVGAGAVPAPVAPGGLVNIFNGTALIGTGTLDANGRVTVVIPNRPAGRLSLTAAYAGNANYQPAVSPAVGIGVPDPPLFVVGSDNGAVVCVYEADGELSHGVNSFGPEFLGVRPTLGDLTGDGVPDVIVGSGPGNRSRVAVAEGRSRALLTATIPFEEGFDGGVTVAAADFDGDGRAEIAVGADYTGGPRVRVFRFQNGVLVPGADFFAFEPWFTGGVRLAAADVDRDGIADLIVGAGKGGGPRVAVFDGAALATGRAARIGNDFFAFEPWFDGGVYVAAADVTGDGYAEIIVGAGERGGPRVVVFDGFAQVTGGHRMAADFFARPATDTGGVRVAARDINADGQAEIVVGAGVRNGSRVRIFDGAAVNLRFDPVLDVDAFPGLTAGVYVG